MQITERLRNLVRDGREQKDIIFIRCSPFIFVVAIGVAVRNRLPAGREHLFAIQMIQSILLDRNIGWNQKNY